MAEQNTTPDTTPTYPTAGRNTQPNLVIEPFHKDPVTKGLHVHKDYVKVTDDWAEEAHIPPMRVTERFGDIGSFVEYVQRYSANGPLPTLLTWNEHGFLAVLDYAVPMPKGSSVSGLGEPGRCQWIAEMPFIHSRQWDRWISFANGQVVGQKTAVERLEDYSEDIVDPDTASLMSILRSLRTSMKSDASADLRPDGTTTVSYRMESVIKAGAGSVDLPPHIGISIPVLKGMVNDDGQPIVYQMLVRVRASVDDNAHLALRFSIPDADRALELAWAHQVSVAKELFGDGVTLLRAAD